MLKFFVTMVFVLPTSLDYVFFMNFFILLMFLFLFNFKFMYFFTLKMMFILLDNMSTGFILLTIFMIIFLVLSMGYLSKSSNYSYFLVFSVMLFVFLVFSFSSSSIFSFYIFFESSLIPIYLIIMGWGYQPERLEASFYMFLYTIFFSLPLMVFIFFLFYSQGSMNIIFLWHSLFLDFSFLHTVIWISMTLAFLVKLPLFMFHIWLPKAHVEAPVGGSMILASVLLKLGLYGFYRVIFFFSFLSNLYLTFLFIFSLCGGLFSSFICLTQCDLKVLIAYSSVSHMGVCLCSLMTLNSYGMMGMYSMALAHGFCSSGLFYLSYCNYSRVGSRSFFLNKGLMNSMPLLILFWFFFCVINMSSPPFLTIFSEICMIISIISYSFVSFSILFFMLFLSCSYSLYLFSLISHGKMNNFNFSHSEGLVVEFLIISIHFLPLFFTVFLMDFSLNL